MTKRKKKKEEMLLCDICKKSFRGKRALGAHQRLTTQHFSGTQDAKTPVNQEVEEKLTTTLSPDKVNEVLMFTWDLLDRSAVRFLLLKETAKQVRDKQMGLTPDLHVETIELGVQQRYLTETGARALKGLLLLSKINAEWTDTYIRFTRNDVPVFIKILQRNYDFFQNPSKVFYRTEEFEIPNPFDGYWSARHIIK